LKPPPSRILALDLGKKRVGLAISDPLGITAQGLPNLNRTNKRADLAALGALAATREVGLILMGNPINMRGGEGRQSGWVREFAAALEAHTRLPVKLWDERLTSVEAGRVLRASGISIEKRAAAVDRLSAVILLQSYLDSLGASFGLGPEEEVLTRRPGGAEEHAESNDILDLLRVSGPRGHPLRQALATRTQTTP
jgi:putative Holliday junction resolvase